MKKINLYILSVILMIPTFFDGFIGLMLVLILPIILVVSSIKFSNTGKSRLTLLKEFLNPMILAYTVGLVLYLITNSGDVDTIFGIPDKGLLLNILLRGGSYIILALSSISISFFILLAFNNLVAKNIGSAAKYGIIWYILLIVIALFTIMPEEVTEAILIGTIIKFVLTTVSFVVGYKVYLKEDY